MEVKAPNWFQKAKIYHILVDRFSGSITGKNRPQFMGGTIKGIIEKLDYLSNLGINTLWLSPFFRTTAYHGYHITDFYKTDDRFGTIDDIKTLITESHKLNLKIITDFVPNHCSSHHPFFVDAQSNIDSQYFSWFYFKQWPSNYLCFMDYKSLPKLNLNNNATYKHITEAAKYWLSLGFDGFRLDHAIGPDHKFWQLFYHDIKKSYPNTVLIGEVWGQGFSPRLFNTIGIKNKSIRRITGLTQDSLQHEYIGVLDAVFDFKLQYYINHEVKKGSGFTKNKHFIKTVQNHLSKYPNSYPVLFLDNHDMNRFMLSCNNNFDLLLETLEFILSLNKPIVIYYGTEYGVTQSRPFGSEPHSDLLARAPFKWQKISKQKIDKVRNIITSHT
ncbi:MAG: hypothetical protein JW717_00420 [Marinilabiliaceae bacterium]|nr:hypothetical protein [Marinilabiliaceae bacterium]